MNKLSELINKLCPNGVEYKPLEKCCNILDNMRKPITKSAREKGNYPYYGANGIQDYVSNYIFDGKFILVGEDGSVINRNGNPIVTWAEGKIWVNNHAHIIEEIEGIQLRYLYYYIQTINVANLIHGNIPKLNQGDFRKLRIAVPPMEVQCEIIRILDKFTELEAELEAELENRKKQYEYYRDKLLNFDETGNHCDCTHTHTHGYFYKQEIKWITISDILIKNGKDYKHLSDGNYPVYGTGGIITYVNSFVYDKPSVLIPRKGSLNKLYYVEEPFWNVDTIYYTVINSKIVIPKYIYYILSNMHLEKLNIAGGIPSLTQATLYKIKIPVPSLEVQEKLVNILNKFDKIINGISEGLPAEIEARQQQYEYYRDKILTFKELENE